MSQSPKTQNINHNDVQAIFRGFDKRWPQGRFYYCRYESSTAGHALLQFIRNYDNHDGLTSYADLDDFPDVCINAAFTYNGLSILGLTPDVLLSFPGEFRQGMERRAKLLGDTDDSDPKNWDEMWKDNKSIHVWIGVYARSNELLEKWDQKFSDWREELASKAESNKASIADFTDRDDTMHLGSSFIRLVPRGHADPHGEHEGDPPVSVIGTQDVRRFWSNDDTPMHIDDPKTNPKGSFVMEHFGFRDGISQPVISGLDENRAKERNDVAGGGKISAKKGDWEALATGEFLLGYVDEMGEIPIAPVPPTLAINGSFMVQRKLEQKVDLWRDYLRDKAKGREDRNGQPMTGDYLAEKMMGRHRDGKPFGGDGSLNDFRYADDLKGQKCPMGAHMRRANPRDSMCMDKKVAKKFGSLLANRHRILRRAITYGDPVPHGKKEAEVNSDGQGLMFITLQSSITGQYEFVQREWMNFGNDLNQGNDRDPVVGNQQSGDRMTIPGDTVNPTFICQDLPRFVTTRGGEYFFLPGVSAFDLLAAARYTRENTQA